MDTPTPDPGSTPTPHPVDQPAACGLPPTPSPNAVIDASPRARKPFWTDHFTRWLGLDLRSLALMRFVMGIIVIGDLIQRATSLRAHYSDEGVLPRDMLIDTVGDGLYWSLHNLSGDARIEAVLFAIAGLFAFMMTIGYRTRLATFATWVLTVSVINRNPLIGQSGDVLLRLMLFYSCFLPLGARWSVDSACNSKPRPKDDAVLSPATFAYVGQICLLYWFSAAFKWAPTWLDGQAVYFALHCDMYTAAPGIWLRQFEGILPYLTWAAIATEVGAPFVLLCPIFKNKTKLVAAVLMIGLHLSFGFFLAVGIFAPIAIAFWLPVIPTSAWDRLFARLATPKRKGMTIYIDGHCAFCWRCVMLLKTFFLLPQTRILTAQSNPQINAVMRSENSWVVVDHEGTQRLRGDALAYCLAASPIAFPVGRFLRLPGVRQLTNRVYRFVASHRGDMTLVTSLLEPRPLKTRYGWMAGIFVLAAFSLTIPNNFKSLNVSSVNFPPGEPNWLITARIALQDAATGLNSAADFTRFPVGVLQLDQNWAMYAPSPLRNDGWFIAEAYIGDGTTVDLFTYKPVTWDKPEVVSLSFPDQRWQKYMENMSRDSWSNCRAGLCRYLCRRWNETHGATQQVNILNLRMMMEETRYLKIMPPVKLLLAVHHCSNIPHAIDRVAAPATAPSAAPAASPSTEPDDEYVVPKPVLRPSASPSTMPE